MFDTIAYLVGITLSVVFVTLIVLRFVRRNNWHDVMEPHNDAIGFVYSAIAVLYAVVLGFTLIAVWERFDAADATVNDEANALTDLYIMSASLPEDKRAELEGLLGAYIVKAVDVEWNAMSSSDILDNCACDEARAIWRWYLVNDPALFPNDIVYEESLTRLSDFQDSRRTRLNMASGGLANFILALLALTAIPTVLGPCILGVRNRTVHITIVVGAALSITLMVASVFLINRPFDGHVHVGPEALHEVLDLAEYYQN